MSAATDAQLPNSVGAPKVGLKGRKLLRGGIYLVVVLAIWQAYVSFADVPSYLLPGPIDVVRSVADLVVTGELWPHLTYTIRNIMLGLVIGTVVGCLLG